MNEFFGIKRGKDETDFEFCLRVCLAKVDKSIDADWSEIIEAFDLKMHPDTLRKNFVGQLGVQHVVAHYEEKLIKQLQDSKSDQEKKLENKARQTQLEKLKVKDERQNLNRLLRLQARWEALIEVIQHELEQKEVDKYLNHVKQYKENDENNEAILMISDTHIGMTVSNALNQYNKEICINRFQKLIESTIKNCIRNNVSTLNVALAGDLIDGLINLSGRIQQNEDVIHQVFTGAELITEVIVELSKHVKKINVWNVNGNHGRVSKDIKECLDGESFESMLYEYMRLRLEILSQKIDL